MKNLSREAIQRMTGAQGSSTTIGGSGGGVGISMSDVWAAMAGNTDEQIDISHMTGVQTWADGRFLKLAGGTMTGNIVIGNSTFYADGTNGGINSLALSDDCILGDCNIGGHLGLKSLNSNTAGIAFYKQDGSSLGRLTVNNSGAVTWNDAALATQKWVGNNYLSIAFFSRLFQAYNGTTAVNPNDTTTTIDNIKAMFGFWTDFYISALGTGGQSTVGLRLSQLADVNVAGVTDGQALVYNAATQKWIPGTAGGGTDMQTIWAQMALSGNEQINYSHISNAVKINNGTITIGSSAITPLTSVTFSDLTTHPTTISGYGITDAKIVSGTITLGSATITPLTQSTGDDRYLKLSGGTISGLLSVNYTSGSSTRWTGIEVTSPADESSIGFGIDNDGRTVFGRYQGRGFVWNSNGSEVMTFLDGGNVGVGTSSPSYKLHVNGTFRANTSASIADIDIGYSNEINNTNGILHLQYRGSNGIVLCNNGANTHIGGLLSIVAGQRIYPNEGDLYIGNGSNAGWLMLQDVCSQASRGDGNWSIRTNGNAVFANVQSNGYVTALSDERKKDVVGEVELTVEQIATARTVLFRWKDKRDNDLHMGCIAQDWQVLTPQLVHDRNDELSMEYNVIAAIGTIKNSQRLVNHETRLRRLEKMFALNENDLED